MMGEMSDLVRSASEIQRCTSAKVDIRGSIEKDCCLGSEFTSAFP